MTSATATLILVATLLSTLLSLAFVAASSSADVRDLDALPLLLDESSVRSSRHAPSAVSTPPPLLRLDGPSCATTTIIDIIKSRIYQPTASLRLLSASDATTASLPRRATTYAFTALLRPLFRAHAHNVIYTERDLILSHYPAMLDSLWNRALAHPYLGSIILRDSGLGVVLDRMRERHKSVRDVFMRTIRDTSLMYARESEAEVVDALIQGVTTYLNNGPVLDSLARSQELLVARIRRQPVATPVGRWADAEAKSLHAHVMQQVDPVLRRMNHKYRPHAYAFLHTQLRRMWRSLFSDSYLHQHPTAQQFVDNTADTMAMMLQPLVWAFSEYREQEAVRETSEDVWRMLAGVVTYVDGGCVKLLGRDDGRSQRRFAERKMLLEMQETVRRIEREAKRTGERWRILFDDENESEGESGRASGAFVDMDEKWQQQRSLKE